MGDGEVMSDDVGSCMERLGRPPGLILYVISRRTHTHCRVLVCCVHGCVEVFLLHVWSMDPVLLDLVKELGIIH